MPSYNFPMPTNSPLYKPVAINDVSVDETAGGVTILPVGDLNSEATRAIATNTGTDDVYICDTSTVTTAKGYAVSAGKSTLEFLPSNPPYAICASGKSTTLRVIQLKPVGI